MLSHLFRGTQLRRVRLCLCQDPAPRLGAELCTQAGLRTLGVVRLGRYAVGAHSENGALHYQGLTTSTL